MAAIIELEDLPSTDRIEVLRDHMRHAPVPLELKPTARADLRVRSKVADFGDIHLLSTLGSGATVVRTPRLAQDDTEPSLIVSVLGRGESSIFQQGRLTRLETGSIVAYATTEPYWSTFERDTLRHSFRIPTSQLTLPNWLIASQLALPLVTEPLLAEIVASHLIRMATTEEDLVSASRDTLEQPTLDLVRSLLATNAGEEDLARGALRETLSTRIFEFARLHLTDRELGAPMIARALGISERHVYATVRRSGVSLGDWIREQRIAEAAVLLTRFSSRMSVAAIAHRFAFADHAHFTRTFRSLRGTTPTEWRRLYEAPQAR